MAGWDDMRVIESDWLGDAHAGGHVRFERRHRYDGQGDCGVVLMVDGRHVAQGRGGSFDLALEDLMVRLGEIRESREMAA